MIQTMTYKPPVVEVTRPDGTTMPGIELDRRVDGDGGDIAQERVVVAVSVDDEVVEVDTAASRVEDVDGLEADLVRDRLEDKLEDRVYA